MHFSVVQPMPCSASPPPFAPQSFIITMFLSRLVAVHVEWLLHFEEKWAALHIVTTRNILRGNILQHLACRVSQEASKRRLPASPAPRTSTAALRRMPFVSRSQWFCTPAARRTCESRVTTAGCRQRHCSVNKSTRGTSDFETAMTQFPPG